MIINRAKSKIYTVEDILIEKLNKFKIIGGILLFNSKILKIGIIE